ncbi:MAG: 50S ribosomal protein L10, partial [Candidatus Woesebacteria bacterium]|jgi:large subunit ribosomal protein L10
MLVVKNTLFKLAGKAAKVAEETLTDTVLSGPTALVITEADPIAPIQVIGAFAKKHDLPQIKVGIYEGDFQDKDAILRLANLPGKEALVAQVIGGIAAPMYALNFTLKSNMQKLIYILEKASKKEAN